MFRFTLKPLEEVQPWGEPSELVELYCWIPQCADSSRKLSSQNEKFIFLL
jgi:hypothetical protein